MKPSRLPLFLIGLVLLLSAVAVSAADSITTISPAEGHTGKTTTITITGVNFTETEGSVKLMMSGEANITASISSWSADTIVCKFKIGSSKITGDWDVVVVKGYDSTEIVKSEAFTITDPIVLSSISPTSARVDNDSVDFTIAGTGLSDISDVYLYHKNYDNITADDVGASSSTKVKGTFDLTDETKGTYEVCVVDSYTITECDLSFTVETDDVGSIDISSSPSGATIYVDGTQEGTTPGSVDDLVEGSHKVVLRKSGYDDWGKIVTVTSGDTSDVDAELVAITTIATPVPTTITALLPTAEPTTVRTTLRSTIKIPTTWADTTTTATTAASPLDPVIVIGAAAGIGMRLVLLRRR
jgi:PEGA domain/IPT/TIG domain